MRIFTVGVLLLGSFLSMTGMASAKVSCLVSITTPASGTVSGNVTVSFSESCTDGTAGFNRLWVTNTDHGGNTTKTYDFDAALKTYSWDSTQVPNGLYDAGITVWDPVTGAVLEGQSQQLELSVSNGSVSVAPAPSCPAPYVFSNCRCILSSSTPTVSIVMTPSPAPTPGPTLSPKATPTATPARTPSPTPTATPSSIPTVGAFMKANDFLDTLGADSHMVQGYETEDEVIAALNFVGFRHYREDFTDDPNLISKICGIHQQTGATVDELTFASGNITPAFGSMTDSSNIAYWIVGQSYEPLAACGALFAEEGPNEPNNQSFSYTSVACNQSGGTFKGCAYYMRDFYKELKADPKLASYPVFAETEPGAEPDNVGLQFLKIPVGSGTLMPDGTVYADFANLHNYVQCNGCSSVQDNQAWNAEGTGLQAGSYDGLDGEFINNTFSKHFPAYPTSGGVSLPKVTTETGWATPGISSDQQGKLLTNLYLSAAARGWSYTSVYLMIDDDPGGNGYGMFANAIPPIPKPAAVDAHNMTSILADASSNFATRPLQYQITPQPSTVHSLLLEKSDGSYWLAIWDDRPVGEGSDSVTISLPETYATVNVYDITRGTSPIKTRYDVSSVPLILTDHALIVEF